MGRDDRLAMAALKSRADGALSPVQARTDDLYSFASGNVGVWSLDVTQPRD
jgi:hypothetical protein